LQLETGAQTLRIQTPVSVAAENHKRGIALKEFVLKAKASRDRSQKLIPDVKVEATDCRMIIMT
jgi:hypothetical protein